MLSRRHLRYWVSVTGVLLAATIALAGKPAPPAPIIATTTDQNFLNNVKDKVSSQTVFNLAIDVSGTGTHYRYQIGPAATIDPSDAAAYSSPSAEATPLSADTSGEPDGDFVLCLQALQIDKKGNIKYVQTPPTVYAWEKDTPPPSAPQFFDAIGGEGVVNLIWLPSGSDTSGYLVVRRTGAAVDWQPADGQTYSPGDLDDGTHLAVYIGSGMSAMDANVVPETTYYYAVFARSAAFNYSDPATDSASPTASGGGGDYLWYLEQLAGTCPYDTIAMDGFGDVLRVARTDFQVVYNTFSMATKTWTEEQPVPDLGPPDFLQLDGDGAGNYILGYYRWNGGAPFEGNPVFNVKLYSPSTGWTPTTQIDSEFQVLESSLREFGTGVAISPDGTAMAVWREGPTPTYHPSIYARRFDGTSWGPAVKLGDGGNPHVAADDAGHFMVVYEIVEDTAEDRGALYSAYYNDGWTPSQRLTIHNQQVYGDYGRDNWAGHRIESAGVGRFVALYRSSSTGDLTTEPDDLHARVFDVSLGWGNEQSLEGSSEEIDGIRLAASDNGTAIAVWGQGLAVYASHFDGNNWDLSPTQLSYDPSDYYGDRPYGGLFGVTMDVHGNGMAFFHQGTDVSLTNTYEVYAIHYDAESGWDFSSRGILSTPEDGVTEGPLAVAGNASGEAVVTWKKNPPGDVIVSRCYAQ